MKRPALSCAALFVTASTFMCIFGFYAVAILGVGLCLVTAICVIFRKLFKIGLRPAAVLLISAAFCLFIGIYNSAAVEPTNALAGQTETVTCRVIEEPEIYNGTTRLLVKTDGNNSFDTKPFGKIKLYIYTTETITESPIEEGDILKTELSFKETNKETRLSYYSKGIYISTYSSDIEIIGHKESIYTLCIDLRKAVRNTIYTYADGDIAAILEGLVMGGTDNMSDKLYNQFKLCGASHLTAVSGMHIGALCMMILSLLKLVMSRRKAALITIIPLTLSVMLAGLTASALRAGIMCALILLADVLLSIADSLNSLGVSVMLLLIVNPYYICSLSFQLSCSAALGVILIMPYAITLTDRIVRFNIKFLSAPLKAIIIAFLQAIGAVLCTMPFQMLEFGYISLIAPIVSVLVCSASVWAMAFCIAGVTIYFIPLLKILAMPIFEIAKMLAEYIKFCIENMSEVPFAYIPFGNDIAILWLGLAMGLIWLWELLRRPVKARVAVMLISALLLSSLWINEAFSRDVITVTVPNIKNGLCAVVTSKEKCVIIGCGGENTANYAVENAMKQSGAQKAEMLLLISDNTFCFNGYRSIMTEINPRVTVVPSNFGSSYVFIGETLVAESGKSIYALEGRLKIEPLLHDNGCVYRLNLCGKQILIGIGRYDFDTLKLTADLAVTSSALPQNIKARILVIATNNPQFEKIPSAERVYTTAENDIILKFKKGKGISVYAG